MKYCLTNISVRCTSELSGGMKCYKYFGALHLLISMVLKSFIRESGIAAKYL